jgi:hypothetical protein
MIIVKGNKIFEDYLDNVEQDDFNDNDVEVSSIDDNG